MAYSEENKTRIVSEICALISDGLSLRKAVAKQAEIDYTTFYVWIDEDKIKSNQYARAVEQRTEKLADEIVEISDDTANDTIYTDKGEIENKEWVNRSKLRVDTRKWLMSKMMPKKYGDKIDVTTDGEKLPTQNISVNIVPPKED